MLPGYVKGKSFYGAAEYYILKFPVIVYVTKALYEDLYYFNCKWIILRWESPTDYKVGWFLTAPLIVWSDPPEKQGPQEILIFEFGSDKTGSTPPIRDVQPRFLGKLQDFGWKKGISVAIERVIIRQR